MRSTVLFRDSAFQVGLAQEDVALCCIWRRARHEAHRPKMPPPQLPVTLHLTATNQDAKQLALASQLAARPGRRSRHAGGDGAAAVAAKLLGGSHAAFLSVSIHPRDAGRIT